MRISMVTVANIFAHPLKGSPGSTVRVRELALSLKKLGVESFLLSPYVQDGVAWDSVKLVRLDGIALPSFLSNLSYRYTRKLYYNKWLNKHLFSGSFFQKRLAKKFSDAIVGCCSKGFTFDVFQAECPPDVTLFGSLMASRKLGTPVVADLHNISSEEFVASGTIRRSDKAFIAMQDAMKDALSEIDKVVVVSEEMKRYVIDEFEVPNNKIAVAPPGGRLRRTGPTKDLPSIIYSGLLSYREHVDLFVGSMPFVKKEIANSEFYLSSIGENLDALKSLANSLGIRPNFFWIKDTTDFYTFLSSVHVGVLPSSNDLARRMGTPVKLFDYMSVGLPVVANDIGGWASLISEEKIGLTTDDDPCSFAKAIIELITDREFAEKCGRRGQRLVETKYNWDTSARIISQVYNKLLTEN
jgi:glycosyltransferase involved in cell wall biosynthesis